MTPAPGRLGPDRPRAHTRPAATLRSVSRREAADPSPLAPRLPRRVSGPVARSAATAPAGVALPRGAARPVAPRALPRRLRLGALPEHRLVDRLLRSRLWIWALGALLGGIVAMQVSLLKLNSGISRAVETATTLERQNADLEAAIARLSSPDRIELGAGSLGMLMPAAGDVRYLSSGPQDAAKAVRRMQPPSDAAAALLANGGIIPGSLADAAPTPETTSETTVAPASAETSSTPAAAAVAGQG